MEQTATITVETLVNIPAAKAWELWTNPEHIVHWNTATDSWHTPSAENDVRIGGKFLSRMEAKDGSMGFDFVGTYVEVITNKYIRYIMGDGRKAEITFTEENNQTKITETFDPEKMNPSDMQRSGWQAILDNFKNYAEGLN